MANIDEHSNSAQLRAAFISSSQNALQTKELKMLNRLINDENGFIVSAEIVLIFTLVFCAVAVGIAVVRDALVQELGDVAEAIGALNQSYNYAGITAPTSDTNVPFHAACSGSGFNDGADACDCNGIILVTVAGKNDPSGGTTIDGSNATP
jgi:hypothetical protein